MMRGRPITFLRNANGCHICTSHKPGNHGHPRNKQGLITRQVFLANNGNLPSDMCVLHKCDTPMCINPSHLFLGTRKENNQDRHKKGRTSRVPRVCGVKNGMRKLDIEQVIEIRLAKNILTTSALAKFYGIAQSTISAVQRKTAWRHL